MIGQKHTTDPVYLLAERVSVALKVYVNLGI